jgi:hypothetical protein
VVSSTALQPLGNCAGDEIPPLDNRSANNLTRGRMKCVRLGLRTRHLMLVRIDEQRLLLTLDGPLVDNDLFDIIQ